MRKEADLENPQSESMDSFTLTSLQNPKFANLDFQTSALSMQQAPMQQSSTQQASQSPSIMKSSSLESLISQNEDLMARLKVNLRRLSLLEIENEKIIKENHHLKSSHQSLSDKYLVYQEKDQLWKDRLDALENERNKYIDQYKSFQIQMKHYQSETDRFQKYQEKIKTKVKPYIEQLKQENADLSRSHQFISHENEKMTSEIISLRNRILELSSEIKTQMEEQEKRHLEIIENYEAELGELKSENQRIKEESSFHQIKAIRLSDALLKKDQLENEVLELRRMKESMSENFESELEKFRTGLDESLRKSTRLELENQELKEKNEFQMKQIAEFERKNNDLITQNESLNYLWKSKTEEIERLQLSMESFEKLNVDLSSKVSELRKRLDQAAALNVSS